MAVSLKRKTSVTLDSAVLDDARVLGISVSAIAEAALERAVAEARRKAWLAENAEAFAARSDWHDRNGHPLVDILAGQGGSSWKV